MPVLDVRRHAQRQDTKDDQSPLSAAGRAMCEALARSAPTYALVAASPIARARLTAELIAGRCDALDPSLAPEMSGVLSWDDFTRMTTLADVHAYLAELPAARAFADAMAETWVAIARRAGDGRALAVTHGGMLELAAVALAERLHAALDGPVFGYCEGVSVTYRGDAPVGVAALRL